MAVGDTHQDEHNMVARLAQVYHDATGSGVSGLHSHTLASSSWVGTGESILTVPGSSTQRQPHAIPARYKPVRSSNSSRCSGSGSSSCSSSPGFVWLHGDSVGVMSAVVLLGIVAAACAVESAVLHYALPRLPARWTPFHVATICSGTTDIVVFNRTSSTHLDNALFFFRGGCGGVGGGTGGVRRGGGGGGGGDGVSVLCASVVCRVYVRLLGALAPPPSFAVQHELMMTMMMGGARWWAVVVVVVGCGGLWWCWWWWVS